MFSDAVLEEKEGSNSLDVPLIRVRNICPFLMSEGVIVADWMDMLGRGLLDSKTSFFEFKGSSKEAFALAENRIRHLKLIETDEKTVDSVFCPCACTNVILPWMRMK